jgi:hypothetical protein
MRLSTMFGAFALACALVASAAPSDMRIPFAEPVELEARAGHVEFDAYGRRFALELESNERLLKNLPAARKAQLAPSRLLRGRLAGVGGSWVRIARVGDGLEGAIWDGHDLYAITTRARIDSKLMAPLAVPPSQTVVYRLSDAIGGLDDGFCALAPARARSLPGDTPLEKYRAMVSELQAKVATGDVTDQLEISLIGDPGLAAQFGASAAAEMLARFNIVDGIFAEQVHVLVLASDVRVLPGPDPFTSSDPRTLLDQLAEFREHDVASLAHGLTHLLTGRTLSGNINGIAYIGSLCDAHYGVSLSDTQWDTLTGAQVMAHELGHNFGAGHDGEAGSSCSGTPQSFLMSPTLNGSSTFSQCSLASMTPVIADARDHCVSSPSYADVAISAPGDTVLATAAAPFTLAFGVESVGTLGAQSARVVAMLPAGIAFQSGSVPGGSCAASGANDVSCTLGTVAPGESRDVKLTLLAAQPDVIRVMARVFAANDYRHVNDAASVRVAVRSGVDLGVAMSATASTVYVTDTVDFTIDVTSRGSQAARDGSLLVDLAGMDLVSISAGANSCAVMLGAEFRCELVDLAPGATTRITARGRGRTAGDWTSTASVDVANDAAGANNFASAPIHVQSERGVSAVASSTDVSVVLGQAFEVEYTLTAFGRLASDDVRFEVQGLANGVIESVTAGGGKGTCAKGAGTYPNSAFHCSFGPLSPGASRTVVVRAHMTTGGGLMQAESIYSNGKQDIVQSLQTGIRSAPDVDVAVDLGLPAQPAEGESAQINLGVSSLGLHDAPNVVATLDVPASVTLTSVHHPGWTCTLPTPQRARCAVSSLPSGPVYIGVGFTRATAGQFLAHASVTAERDAVEANDSKDLAVDVLPFLDVGMSVPSRQVVAITGTPKAVSLTAKAGVRPVTGVRITAVNGQGWQVAALSAGGATCRGETWGMSCDVGELAAGATVPVEVTYDALDGGTNGGAQVCATIARDSAPGNDCVSLEMSTFAPTDVSVSVAQATVSATAGGTFHYPLITVADGAEIASDVRVRITLPSFVSVKSVSASAGDCTGTTTLECTYATMSPGTTSSIDITLQADATGTFASSVELASVNDSTSGNNTAAVSVRVDAVSSGTVGGGGSNGTGRSGGGGRLEWLGLVLLALLVLRRLVRQQAAWFPCYCTNVVTDFPGNV